MKQYDRIQKKYVEVVDKPVGSLKRPETCKGKRPHEWVLLIPSMINRQHKPFSKEEVASYYEIEAEFEKWKKNYDDKMEALGLQSFRYSYKLNKFYKCAKCGKER